MKQETSKHLNSPQVYRTKKLVELLRKFSSVNREILIKEICSTETKNISIRTLQRDVKTLNEDYGIIILLDRINNSHSLNEDKSSNIESFLSHIEILATAELLSATFKDKNNALSFVEFENKAAIETIPNFKMILEAIQQQLPVTFNHYSFYHLKEDVYTLKPYFLKQYQNRWYVIGETEKGFRNFGIDRIENITIGTKKFKPKTEEAKDKFSHVIGLNYVDHKMEKIELSFHISQKPYIVSLPLHHSQKEINTEIEGSFDIELRIHPNFEFRQQILKYGSLVKIREPKWLAEEIKEELRKGFENY